MVLLVPYDGGYQSLTQRGCTMETQVSFYKYTTQGERRVARALVRRLLTEGCTVSVQDGLEWTVKASTKEKEILEALATTGQDIIRARRNGERVADFLLIWGNDPDGDELVADYSCNDFAESIIQAM